MAEVRGSLRGAVAAVGAAVCLGPVSPWTGAAAAAEPAWMWPLSGSPAVVRAFDQPASRYAVGHRGVDLAGVPGAAVRAAGAGRVTYAGLLAGRGVVVVSHGELRTTYEPVTATVGVGQPVGVGEVLGRLDAGHGGCSAAACLHWGLRRGEQYLDPTRLVARGPLRLLPVAPAAAGTGAAAARVGTPLINAGAAPVPGPSKARRPGADQPAAAQREARPAPPAERAWSLRAAEAPLGAAAVAALVIGIGLLARPRPLPPAPVSGGIAAPAVRAVSPDDVTAPPGLLLDLDDARLRRQAG